MSRFCHLHIHGEYSQLDGYGSAKAYAEEAKELGFEYLALTDHGNVDGTIKFQEACEKVGIIPIIGCELYIVQDSLSRGKEKRCHITTLVKNQTGWENTLRMLTIANVQGFYRRPRVDPNVFLNHCEGLVVMTACTSSFLIAPWGLQLLADLKEKLGQDLYVEIMPHIYPEQLELNKLVLELSRKHRIRLVATNDAHYPTRAGTEAQEVLLAIQSNARWDDPKRWKFSIDGLYLRTEEEMIDAFAEQGVVPADIVQRALSRTSLVAEKCAGFKIEKMEVHLPKVPGYEERDETDLLEELTQKGFEDRLLHCDKDLADLKVYEDRLVEELGLICELGFQRYFLIVWELIKWCKENDIMCGPGRGSVGGCLVAYCLGITDVDPIEHGLIFSRFISPARIDLPDIDMDFEDVKRDQIRAHLEDNYGKENVCGVSTFSTLKGRSSLRDVSRVFEVPYVDVDAAAKSIVVRSGGDFRSDFTIEDAFETFEDGIKFKAKYPAVAQMAMDLEGQVRGSGQHAAAMCISSDELRDGKRCNLCLRKGVAVCNWGKEDAEYMGMMKLDVLGLSALTVLNESRKMIKINHDATVVFQNIRMDDERVYAEISAGHNVGAFQIGSLGLCQYCKDLGVDKFEDLVHATALWRPGTLRTGMTAEFRLRKKGLTEWEAVHPAVAELTEDTYGIILFQEQVMRLMYDLGGLPWRTCDIIRKVISKSQGEELFAKFKDLFVKGCEERKTLDADAAGDVWDELQAFGSYGFNKSHSVEYSMITYWDMYLKTYYPAEFMACSLSYGAADKREEYIEEARRLGLKIELPKVGVSSARTWQAKRGDDRLFAPFMEIKGVGEKTAEKLAGLQKSDHVKFFDVDTKFTGINKAVRQKLIQLKAFDANPEFSEEEMDEIEKLFPFDTSPDQMRKVRGIFNLLKPHVSTIDSINYSHPTKDYSLYFGYMAELRYGYRKNVLKAKGSGPGDVEGTGESLGGVYGFIKDEESSAMIVFDSRIYAERKDEVEHCEDKWILVKANHAKKTNAMFCNGAAFQEDLLACRLEDFPIDLITKNVTPPDLSDLSGCEECTLREQCEAPVPPSVGRYNAMIVGEAPGKSEDKYHEGFVGKAGEVLWDALHAIGAHRRQFHTTNAVKCFPFRTKTPTKTHITKCSTWLKAELAATKPVVVLALGNTNLKFFKNQDTGIMSLSGTTEWSKLYNCWVCWCVHPAAVLHSPENEELFMKGVENFGRCLHNVGFPRITLEVNDGN